MDWCEQNRVHYIFGLSTNAVLAAQIFAKADDVCVRRATGNLDVVRDYTGDSLCRQILVASPPRRGTDRGDAERSRCSLRRYQYRLWTAAWLYDGLYCARGQAENLIKRHKEPTGV